MHGLPSVIRLDTAIPTLHQNIFSFLCQVNEERALGATLRVAGGWVRDTLLGIHSNDIDIAIESPSASPVSGERFARAVSAFQAEQDLKSRTVSVIRANPELSKHIETATVCIFDLPVEFCALRTDEYCEESRIPRVRPACPEEDAKRRDFTVNALFYNLHTGMVEDFTGGLHDLQLRVLRCPLEPRSTFSDDPLRLLRGVRFVGQLGRQGFRLDESVLACVDQDLLGALQRKVSRERIGKELVKMLSSPNSADCVDLLHSSGILASVLLVEIYFKRKATKKAPVAEVDRTQTLIDTVPQPEAVLSRAVHVTRLVASSFSREDGGPLFVAPADRVSAVLFPLLAHFFRGRPDAEVDERTYALCVNSLKLPLSVYQTLRRMLSCYNSLVDQSLSVAEEFSPACELHDSTKVKIFTALSNLNDRQMMLAAFPVVLLTYVLLEGPPDLLERGDADEVLTVFESLWSVLKAHPTLLRAYTLDVPVAGSELRDIGVPAKEVGHVLLSMRRLMVLNPNFSRDDAMAWLKDNAL